MVKVDEPFGYRAIYEAPKIQLLCSDRSVNTITGLKFGEHAIGSGQRQRYSSPSLNPTFTQNIHK